MTELFTALEASDSSRAVDLFDSTLIGRFHQGLQNQTKILLADGVPASMAPAPRILTHDEIQTLSAREIFARFLYAATPRGAAAISQPEVGDSGRRVTRVRERRVVVGYVLEDDSIAHVVYRTAGAQMNEVMTLVQRPVGWRIRYGEIDSPSRGLIGTIVSTPEPPSDH